VDNGEGMMRAATFAMKFAEICSRNVGCVIPHGTATIAGDKAEMNGQLILFGEEMPIAALKGWIGHMGGASGSGESVFASLMVKNGIIPPCTNFDNPMTVDGKKLNMSWEVRKADLQHVIKNTVGMGGFNTAIIFSKLNE
jgi:3-oxoacyl-[acyl-carrier-protein] synthase II